MNESETFRPIAVVGGSPFRCDKRLTQELTLSGQYEAAHESNVERYLGSTILVNVQDVWSSIVSRGHVLQSLGRNGAALTH